MTLKKRMIATTAFAIAALTAAAVYDTADARTRRAHGSVTSQHGTVTAERVTHRERGSRTRDTTITGANGRQRSAHDERTWNREEGTYSRDHVTTYGDGSQRSVDVDGVRTGQGQYSVDRSVTGRNGETRTQSGDFSVERGDGVRTVTGDINTSNNGQIDYQRTVTHDQGSRSVNASATFEDGTSITRQSSGSCAGGTCSSSGVVTQRDGDQTSWEQSRTRTENGVTRARDVTFADGTTRSVDAERTGNGDGTGTISRTVTGRNGETRTQTGEYEVDRTP